MNREIGSAGSDGRAPDPRIARVVEVVDGDTLRVRFVSGTVRTVRYIGIDAPETPAGGAEAECGGDSATTTNRRLVGGGRVRLEYDRARRDTAGRLLAYVYRASDELFVNGRMVADGHATVLTIPPNVRRARTFIGLARAAREARLGLWAACDTGGR